MYIRQQCISGNNVYQSGKNSILHRALVKTLLAECTFCAEFPPTPILGSYGRVVLGVGYLKFRRVTGKTQYLTWLYQPRTQTVLAGRHNPSA